MILRNDNSLIGDFIGTIPAMIELAHHELQLGVICPDSVAELLDMIPKKYGIKRVYSDSWDKEFNLHGAFALADGAKKLHMIQANYHFVGLPIPEGIPRPELDVKPMEGVNLTVDYILSPFSRSLPDNQKWAQSKWQGLVDAMPDKSFCLIGAGHDNDQFVTGSNVISLWNNSFNVVADLMLAAKGGIISVVTGTSHLAYALGVKNYLFFNQGLWGKNPEAILLDRNIWDIGVQEVINKLNACN